VYAELCGSGHGWEGEGGSVVAGGQGCLVAGRGKFPEGGGSKSGQTGTVVVP